MTNEKEKIITNIKTIRESKNYSEGYIAEKVGISQSTYNRKENGEGDFTLSELLKLGEVLEVSVSKFIDMDLAKVINQYHNQDQSGYIIEHQTVVSDEGYKTAIAAYEKQVEYLKAQNEKLTDVLIKK
jgi:transcriptional regulator with XRE-family HTH domain